MLGTSVFCSLQESLDMPQYTRSVFWFWFSSTFNSLFFRSTALISPLKVSIEKIRVIRIKDIAVEKTLLGFCIRIVTHRKFKDLLINLFHLHIQGDRSLSVIAWLIHLTYHTKYLCFWRGLLSNLERLWYLNQSSIVGKTKMYYRCCFTLVLEFINLRHCSFHFSHKLLNQKIYTRRERLS